jgi:ribosomal protein S13
MDNKIEEFLVKDDINVEVVKKFIKNNEKINGDIEEEKEKNIERLRELKLKFEKTPELEETSEYEE